MFPSVIIMTINCCTGDKSSRIIEYGVCVCVCVIYLCMCIYIYMCIYTTGHKSPATPDISGAFQIQTKFNLFKQYLTNTLS